jgi:hypothetical protein
VSGYQAVAVLFTLAISFPSMLRNRIKPRRADASRAYQVLTLALAGNVRARAMWIVLRLGRNSPPVRSGVGRWQ